MLKTSPSGLGAERGFNLAPAPAIEEVVFDLGTPFELQAVDGASCTAELAGAIQLLLAQFENSYIRPCLWADMDDLREDPGGAELRLRLRQQQRHRSGRA